MLWHFKVNVLILFTIESLEYRNKLSVKYVEIIFLNMNSWKQSFKNQLQYKQKKNSMTNFNSSLIERKPTDENVRYVLKIYQRKIIKLLIPFDEVL